MDRAALRLMCVVDTGPRPELVEALDPAWGVTAVWLRMPGRPAPEVHHAAEAWLAQCAPRRCGLIVGDHDDVAAALGADAVGVQLGFRAAPLETVRPRFAGWVGASCHTADELSAAAAAGADHAVLGPVFEVPGKGPALGLERFAALVAGAGLPIVAVGGIGPDNAAAVRAAGAVGVAAIRSLAGAARPASAARAMRGLPSE